MPAFAALPWPYTRAYANWRRTLGTPRLAAPHWQPPGEDGQSVGEVHAPHRVVGVALLVLLDLCRKLGERLDGVVEELRDGLKRLAERSCDSLGDEAAIVCDPDAA